MNNKEYINTLVTCGKLLKLELSEKEEQDWNRCVEILGNREANIRPLVDFLNTQYTERNGLLILRTVKEFIKNMKDAEVELGINKIIELDKLWKEKYALRKVTDSETAVIYNFIESISVFNRLRSFDINKKLDSFRIFNSAITQYLDFQIDNEMYYYGDMYIVNNGIKYSRLFVNNIKVEGSCVITVLYNGKIKVYNSKDIKNNKEKQKILNDIVISNKYDFILTDIDVLNFIAGDIF